MTAIFVPFTEITATGSSLLCEGSAPIGEAISAVELPVQEMAAEPKIGKLLRCSVIDGVLRVAAEIFGRVAITKIAERVYAGLALIGLPAGDGTVTIERAALVDRPDALGKRSGSAPLMALYTDGVFKMSIPALAKRDTTGAPLQIKIMEPTDLRAAQSDRLLKERQTEDGALAVIRSALRAPIGGTDTEVIRGLYNRR